MIPTYVDGCFAMLHPGQRRRGVLICGPLGDEALNSYRPLVFLAEAFAAGGYPTLRLHYAGTGNSADANSDASQCQIWQDNILAAVTWLRTHCGVDNVTVIGVRIGAALATSIAAQASIINSLILVLPTNGRRFLNELTLAAQITQRVWRTANRIDDGTWFEAHGIRLNHASRDSLKAMDITPPLGTHVLLIDVQENAATRALLEQLRIPGIALTAETTKAVGSILRDSHLADVPHATIARSVAWVQALRSGSQAPAKPRIANTTLDLRFATETAVRFGPRKTLFGILCRSRQPSSAPPVLLINTSANPRPGNARIGVDLARSLAADGITSLRMDASGMGDSAPSSGELGRPYSDAMTGDVRDAVELLHELTGHSVIVLGICSGAYHALQSGLGDARVGGMVLINLQRFVWREGDPPDAIRRDALRPTQFYLRHILDWQSWRRLISADFDVLNLLRVLATRVLQRSFAAIDPAISVVAGNVTRVGRVRRSVRALGLRGVPILYVLGNNDPGVEELAAYFGPDGRRLRQQPTVTFRTLANSDHTLSSHAVRTTLNEEVTAWIKREFSHREPTSQGARNLQPSNAD